MTRQEASEWLQDIKQTETFTDWTYAVAIDMAIEALNGRPRGEWIVHDIVCREEICLPYECPNCGFRYSRRFNFCSNCGADMRGEDE